MAFFPFKPLPEISERLSGATAISRPYAAEWRTAQTELRTSFLNRFALLTENYAAAEELIRAGATAEWDVPHWHEKTRFLDLTAGQTVIACDTDAGYTVGGLALIWKGWQEYELATIAALGAGTLTLEAPGLLASYTGAALMPVSTGYLAAPAIRSRPGRRVMAVQIEFGLHAPFDIAATPWGTYRSIAVLECAGRVNPLSGALRPAVQYLTSPAGPVELGLERAYEGTTQGLEVVGHTWKLKQFFHHLRGRDRPFWARSWGGALTVTAAEVSGSSSVTVAETRPAADLVGRHIFLDGLYREILAAVDNGTTATLTLDQSHGKAIAAGVPCSLLSLMRSETDQFEIHHKGALSSYATFSAIEVPDVP